jgi:hypothetical protein
VVPSKSALDMILVAVKIVGPFGYSPRQTVSTGRNTTVNLTIPDSVFLTDIHSEFVYILKEYSYQIVMTLTMEPETYVSQ